MSKKKPINKRKFFELLYILGSSEKPITSREIEEKYVRQFGSGNKPRDSYVYQVISKLTETHKQIQLFNLDRVKEIDYDFKSNFLYKIKTIFDLELDDNEIRHITKDMNYKIFKEDNYENLVFYDKNEIKFRSINIKFNTENKSGTVSIKGQDGLTRSRRLVIKSKDIFAIYENREQPHPRLIQCIMRDDMERDSYLYCISFEGFVFYIQQENNLRKIEKVLKGILKNEYVKSDYVFLDHPDLRYLFVKNIKIEILKEIFSIYVNDVFRLDLSDDYDFKFFIIEMYFSKLNGKILNVTYLIQRSKRKKLTRTDFIKYTKYQENILELLINYQNEKLISLKGMLEIAKKEQFTDT